MLGLGVTEIADYFGREITAINKGSTKIEEEIISDIGLQRTVQEIAKSAKEEK